MNPLPLAGSKRGRDGGAVSPQPPSAAAAAAGPAALPPRPEWRLLHDSNPVVFLDIRCGAGGPVVRLKFELFADVAPRTAENFRQLCTGEFRVRGVPVGYKGAGFHQIVRGYAAVGGDFVKGDGTGSQSIYGSYFDDETLTVRHGAAGVLSMRSNGPNRNGCQFLITGKAISELDGRAVAFGRLLAGDEESIAGLDSLMEFGGGGREAAAACVIVECGEL